MIEELIKKYDGYYDKFGNWYPNRVIEKKSHPQTAMHRPLTNEELNQIVKDSQNNGKR